MKFRIVFALLMAFAITPAFADKPQWAGKGKPDKEAGSRLEQWESRHSGQRGKSYEDDDSEYEDENQDEDSGSQSREQRSKKSFREDKPRGLIRQTEKKTEQEQKEMGRGSEKGREAREIRKKWWKFWE